MTAAVADKMSLELLASTPELERLQCLLDQSRRRFDEVQAEIPALLDQRQTLEHQLRDPSASKKTRLALREVRTRIAELPDEGAAAAEHLADTTLEWANYVLAEAEAVRLTAKHQELNDHHLAVGPNLDGKRSRGARDEAEIDRYYAAIQPLITRQDQAKKLTNAVYHELERVFGIRHVRPRDRVHRQRWIKLVRQDTRDRLRA